MGAADCVAAISLALPKVLRHRSAPAGLYRLVFHRLGDEPSSTSLFSARRSGDGGSGRPSMDSGIVPSKGLDAVVRRRNNWRSRVFRFFSALLRLPDHWTLSSFAGGGGS